MKIEISKEWCIRMAQLEANAEIGAGRLAIDPVLDGEFGPVKASDEDVPNIAFGRFIRLMRRKRGISLENLAEKADVEITELVEIENDTHHKPELRTTHQLAKFFNVPQSGLMQVSGLAVPKDVNLYDEAVRFAARSSPTTELTHEESVALEAFVAVLSKQK